MLFALSAFLLAPSADAGEIRLGSLTEARAQSQGWALDANELTNTRAALVGATEADDGFTVVITDIDATLDATVLAGVDAFLVNWVADGALTADELTALATWVDAGGVLLLTCDDTSHDDVCEHLGYVLMESNYVAPLEPTTAGATNPLFSGPAGTVTTVEGGGNQGRWSAIPASAESLAVDQESHPAVAAEKRGLGQIYAFGDIDLFSNQTIDETGFESGANGMLFSNLIAEVDEQVVVCGDEEVEGAEECDDANSDNTDACTSECLNATCGDGFTQVGVEDCDDGNTDADDGCSETCEVEEEPEDSGDTDTDTDSGDTAEADPDAELNCGCSSQGPGPLPYLALPLALLLFRRRDLGGAV